MLFTDFMHWLANPNTPIVFVAIILAIFAVFLMMTMSLKPVIGSINQSVHIFDNIPSKPDFFNRFSGLHAEITANKYLAEPWTSLAETFIVYEDHKIVYTTRRPAEYLNEMSVLHGQVNLRLLSQAPSFLIGWGLFFTFLGLVGAVHVASQGIGAEDGGQQALKDLLTFASAKFSSSVVALICSLILSKYKNRQLYMLQRAVETICRKLESVTTHITIEQLLYETLRFHKKQTEKLDTLLTKLVEKA